MAPDHSEGRDKLGGVEGMLEVARKLKRAVRIVQVALGS